MQRYDRRVAMNRCGPRAFVDRKLECAAMGERVMQATRKLERCGLGDAIVKADGRHAGRGELGGELGTMARAEHDPLERGAMRSEERHEPSVSEGLGVAVGVLEHEPRWRPVGHQLYAPRRHTQHRAAQTVDRRCAQDLDVRAHACACVRLLDGHDLSSSMGRAIAGRRSGEQHGHA